MPPNTSHESVPVNQKRQTAFAKDEARKAIPTIATAVVFWVDNPQRRDGKLDAA